jgi:hypothetical protein
MGTGFWILSANPGWNSTKNEMELCTLGPNGKFNGKFDVAFCIAFGEIEGLEGKSAIPVLDQFVDMVETIIGEIETECRRRGFI